MTANAHLSRKIPAIIPVLKVATVSCVIFLLSACSTRQEIKYPAELTQQQSPQAQSSFMVARSAYDFKDHDIAVPANFNPQGLDNCNFSSTNENDNCPLKKPIIRVYFDGNDTQPSDQHNSEISALKQLNNDKLALLLESQLAGLNRFRIVTRDALSQTELQQQMSELSTKELAERLKNNKPLQPDYLLKIDTVKTAQRFYAEYNGMAQYSVELTASMIDPYSKEKLAYPNVGKIRVEGTDVKSKQQLVYTEVSGRYYTGFDYTNENNVNAVFNLMASKAFDVLIARLLTEMPATAQVQAFRDGQITLDRGRNAGLLDQDTVILFQYQAGFIDPIAVATVTPSSESAIGQIVRWKKSDIADNIRTRAQGKVIKTNTPVFAVSVGLPQSYVKNRL
ncbi:MAG: hypothetical protein HWE10_07740 [Gammaproteobacteria bacterium]|nr:hypothetical protein [Gammaproteobacteria bacterium]